MSSACRPTIRSRIVGVEWRRRRRRAGLSEADVERCIGARPGTIGDLEAGRAVLDDATERHLVAVLRHVRR